MKRGKKLIWLLLVVAVLVGVMVLLPKLTAEEEPEPEPDTTIQLLNLDTDTVQQLSWTHDGRKLSFSLEGNRWVNADDATFPTEKTKIVNMLDAFAPLNAMSEVTNAGDLSQYGLTDPAISVEIVANGQTTCLHIGDENAMGGLRYLTMGDGKVYLVSVNLYVRFNRGLFDVMVKDTLPNFAQTEAIRLVVDGEESWPEATTELVYAVSSLAFTDYAAYNAKDVSVYGLDAPRQMQVYYVNSEGQNASLTLEFGDEAENGTYIRYPDSGMVYLVDTELVNTIFGE